ncbi:MAG: hypothetical protein MJE66_14430 [Proteobacteria bacterium]|nr:hypothetical protein [Pseudomonadota bacterium]
MTPSEPVASTRPLSADERARGRRLAFASHPAGMTFRMAFSQHIPTLVLVSLGASETWVGVQNAFVYGFLVLQLPTLWAVAHASKRRILVLGQSLALAASAPFLAFGFLREWAGESAVALALVGFALTSAGIHVSGTVWFPLLRGYVEPDRIGRFFGQLRTGWHLTLIAYFLGSQAWLSGHPGSFGPLFAVAWGLGLVRVVLIARLPERNARTGDPIRLSEALALVRTPGLRRYLAGAAWGTAVRAATLPFVIVMLRREIGFTDAQVLLMTVGAFAGGLASLVLWGRAVDRFGPAPIFRWTSLGLGALLVALVWADVQTPATGSLALLVLFFFLYAVFASGFGVADTRVLFDLSPADAPARTLVVGSVAVGLAAGVAPAVVGLGLSRILAGAGDALDVYRGFFLVAALLQALAFWPLRHVRPDPPS